MDKELGRKCLQLQRSGDWRGAFQIIFDTLDRSPEDEDASYLTFVALAAGQQKIPREILDDSRLDRFFCHCDLCGSWWIPHGAAMKAVMGASLAHYTSLNPIGIQCQSCRGVFCHDCYQTPQTRGMGLVITACPKCHSMDVGSPMEPNGRRACASHSARSTKRWWHFWR
jgi:hypothetical protein